MNWNSKLNEEILILVLRTMLRLVDRILEMNEQKIKGSSTHIVFLPDKSEPGTDMDCQDNKKNGTR